MIGDKGWGFFEDPDEFTDTLVPVTQHQEDLEPERVTDNLEDLLHPLH